MSCEQDYGVSQRRCLTVNHGRVCLSAFAQNWRMAVQLIICKNSCTCTTKLQERMREKEIDQIASTPTRTRPSSPVTTKTRHRLPSLFP